MGGVNSVFKGENKSAFRSIKLSNPDSVRKVWRGGVLKNSIFKGKIRSTFKPEHPGQSPRKQIV